MSKSNRGYYVMIYRSILQCMVIVLVGLPAWAQQQDEARNQSLHVYFIGNSVASQGKGADFDKNDFDPTKPGSGADLSKADKYTDRWTAKYTGGWGSTNETRDYFDHLLVAGWLAD